jgi:hypothetical protein
MANKLSRTQLMTRAGISGPAAPESIDFPTTMLPTKPIAYKNVTKKIAYATTPYTSAKARDIDTSHAPGMLAKGQWKSIVEIKHSGLFRA